MKGAVAVACCRRTDEADPADLYPDPDAAPLQAALGRAGCASVLVAWDDPAIDWSTFNRVVLSSTWDSVDRPSAFLAWVERVSGDTKLFNPGPVIGWNLDKRHQRELGRAGIPLIPTEWLTAQDVFEPPAVEFVIKPSVSAGGRDTARYGPSDGPVARRQVDALLASGQTVMVQPYLPVIEQDGEVDLIFIDGVFSHAVRKAPALLLGEGVVDKPWERMSWTGMAVPTVAEMEVGETTMRFVADRFGETPRYGRVDLVPGPDRGPLLLEVELIDPYLSLDMAPDAADRLASAILR